MKQARLWTDIAPGRAARKRQPRRKVERVAPAVWVHPHQLLLDGVFA